MISSSVDNGNRNNDEKEADQQQNRPGGRRGIGFFRFVVILAGIPVGKPEIGNPVSGDPVNLFKPKLIKAGFAGAFAAVSAQACKDGQVFLVRACFSVILNIDPFSLGIIDFFTERIDALYTEVGAVAAFHLVGKNVPAEAVKAVRFNRNHLREPGVVGTDIVDFDYPGMAAAAVPDAENGITGLKYIRVGIPSFRKAV